MATTRINKTAGKIFTGIHGWMYKASNGKMGGSSGDEGVVLIKTVGAKTGKDRMNPILSIREGDTWVVVASYSGHDESPGWYHNLRANPDAVLQVGGTDRLITAVELEGDERDAGFAAMVERNPDFSEYQTVTDRVIPVLRLSPR